MIEDVFITIIIPLYNKEGSILNTVNSVLQQTYSKFELLIVNDGSTDNGVKLLEGSIVDDKLKVFNQANQGVSAARNAGVLKSSSDYILFLDADDILLENALAVFSDLIKRYPQGQIYTSNFYIKEKNTSQQRPYCKGTEEKIIKNNYKEYWRRSYCIRTGNAIFRKEFLMQSGLFDIRISYFEDLALNMKLLMNSLIIYSPVFTFVYLRESSSLSCRPQNITKTFAFWLSFKNKSFWAKMILAMNLHTTMRNLNRGYEDDKNILAFKRKYRSKFVYIMLSRILIKLQK